METRLFNNMSVENKYIDKTERDDLQRGMGLKISSQSDNKKQPSSPVVSFDIEQTKQVLR